MDCIPKKIHQIWIQEEELPDKFKDCQRSWQKYQDRGWEYKLWHGTEIRRMLEEHFPHTVSCYDSAKSHSSRSNFARYIILYLHGGIYVDTDMKSIRDIDHLFEGHQFVVCKETPHQLCTCIIGSVAKHSILERCLSYYQNRYYDPYQMSYLASGPVFFSKRFGDYIREKNQDGIIVYDTYVFLPVSFHGRVDMDPDMSDPSLRGAYTIHYWDYSWKKSVGQISPMNALIITILIVLAAAFIVWGVYYSVRRRK